MFAYDGSMRQPFPLSAALLREELSARNLERVQSTEAFVSSELTFGRVPSVIYAAGANSGHGNFLAASYKRICADPAWARRLGKAYTASARLPRASDRQRGELECANSSDALLMNIFCYPGVLRRSCLCGLLGVSSGLRPEFGVRVRVAMRNEEMDRTEVDMKLGSLLVEAKLTETGFGTASRERLLRYSAVEEIFEVDELPWTRGERTPRVLGYQLIRGVLAAVERSATFLLLYDLRRPVLREVWFQVLRAIRSYDLRSRMALLSWQEVATHVPPSVQRFLLEKYGIEAWGSRLGDGR